MKRGSKLIKREETILQAQEHSKTNCI